MRIVLNFILSVVIVSTSLHAQIKTYDVKYTATTSEDPTGYGGLLQISPTRIIALTGALNGNGFMVTLNSEGMVDNKWKIPFIPGSSAFYYYDLQSNTLVLVMSEMPTRAYNKEQLRLVLLDSNLTVKSNVILDSAITGLPTQFDHTRFYGIKIHDSTIVCLSVSPSLLKGSKQIALHLSKDGQIISRKFITDSTQYIMYDPLCQISDGRILFGRSINNSKTKSNTYSVVAGDTSLSFTVRPLIDSLFLDKITPTRDGGVILAYYYKYLADLKIDVAVVEKYDKNFQKQWSTYVPGYNGNQFLYLIESRSGGYYIATSTIDTIATYNHPEYKRFYYSCFQDMVLSRIDTSGRVLFSAYYGTELCNEQTFDMIEDYTDGGIILCGDYSSPAGSLGCDPTLSFCTNTFTGWIFKVDTLGQPAKRTTVTELEKEIVSNNGIKLFPNPSSGILTIEFQQSDSFTTIEILDVNSRILQNTRLENAITRTTIDISSLASGNYFCRLKSRLSSVTRPFIIQR
jgi:hypothetical protein